MFIEKERDNTIKGLKEIIGKKKWIKGLLLFVKNNVIWENCVEMK